MLVCGANGMGFYNVRDNVWACGFDSTSHAGPGNATLISQSGSGMSGIIDCEARLRINLAVSTGNELSVTMDEYLDFALDLPETRVVGLFVETARRPVEFRAALAKAASKKIPIVAIKVGRTLRSAELTVSHSGAMAGDDAAYEALFDCYGVQRVRDMDELATTMIMFAEMDLPGEGGLVSLHDSGGERQLFVDLADDHGVPLTVLSDATVASLKTVLYPELPAVNPLDAWSRGGPEASDVMTRGLSLMLRDKGAAMGAVVHDRAPNGKIYSSYIKYMQTARRETGKPVALVSARQGSGHDERAVRSSHDGLPVFDGVHSFLTGVRSMFAYRDFLARENEQSDLPDRRVAEQWRARLVNGETLSERESLVMLQDFGVPTTQPKPAESAEEVIAIADAISYPVVLKTAAPGVLHKTESAGVILNIKDATELANAYAQLSTRLGTRVIVAPMIEKGVDVFLGMKRDPQFGPIILLGFGGVHAETLHDVVFALPPFSAAYARRCIDRLRLRPLLNGVRGAPAVDIDALCEAAAKFSLMVDALTDVVQELDANPVIATPDAAIAVDALVTGRKA